MQGLYSTESRQPYKKWFLSVFFMNGASLDHTPSLLSSCKSRQILPPHLGHLKCVCFVLLVVPEVFIWSLVTDQKGKKKNCSPSNSDSRVILGKARAPGYYNPDMQNSKTPRFAETDNPIQETWGKSKPTSHSRRVPKTHTQPLKSCPFHKQNIKIVREKNSSYAFYFSISLVVEEEEGGGRREQSWSSRGWNVRG